MPPKRAVSHRILVEEDDDPPVIPAKTSYTITKDSFKREKFYRIQALIASQLNYFQNGMEIAARRTLRGIVGHGVTDHVQAPAQSEGPRQSGHPYGGGKRCA